MQPENETAKHQSLPDPNLEKGGNPPDRAEPHEPPSPLKTRNAIKIAGVVVALIVAMGAAIFLQSKEKTRGIEAKLAQLESRMQTLESRQNGSATAQSVESLRRDFQKLREQTAEQFAVSERSIQELKGNRSVVAQQAAPQATEPATKQTTESPDKPKNLEPSANRETQRVIDFMETVAKNFIVLVREVLYKTWDFLSELLARPV